MFLLWWEPEGGGALAELVEESSEWKAELGVRQNLLILLLLQVLKCLTGQCLLPTPSHTQWSGPSP